jgi:hypothetical protein
LTSNININNLLENKNISRQNISAINFPSTSLNENLIKISQSIGPKDNISLNNKPQNLKIQVSQYGENNLAYKDKAYIKMTPQNIIIKEDGNQLKNDTKINQTFFNLKQKLEEKEKELQSLRKENNDLQMKIKSLNSKYINEFNNLKSKLENELNNRKEQLNQREILIVNKEKEFNQKQNILNDLIFKKK